MYVSHPLLCRPGRADQAFSMNRAACRVGGLKTVSLVQYQPATNTYVLVPPLARITYLPQQAMANLWVAPGTNITMLLPLLYFSFSVK